MIIISSWADFDTPGSYLVRYPAGVPRRPFKGVKCLGIRLRVRGLRGVQMALGLKPKRQKVDGVGSRLESGRVLG